MMKIFLVFLLVSSSEQLSCIPRSNYQFSTNPFNEIDFKTVLNSLQAFHTQTQVCRVELTFDYNQQYLKVAFRPEHPTGSSRPVEQPRFITTFTLDPHPSMSESLLVYTCLKKEGCDRDFVANLSSWQLDHNYSQLEIKLTDLLIKKNNLPVLCIKKPSEQKLEKCQTGMCHTSVNPLNNISSNYAGGCVGKKSSSTNVIITSIPDYQSFVFKHDVAYRCMYSGCNNAATVYEVVNAILHLYDVSKMFNNENIKNQTSFSITKRTKSSSIPHQRPTPFSNQTPSTTRKEIMSLGMTTILIQLLHLTTQIR
jgi:hypothetical protein